ncbi:unnamed protein product [Mytilus coruscus]|uniref:Uncharacterized protein n=1 Tax=Mytilus coruscus TaxID=42192 RepID=A0A6J8CKB6_MYTCO|nr:unnamed protein product [Mytilus coruscus]
MSETGLHNYLRTNPLVIPHRESDRFGVLLSDGQRIKFEKVNTDSTVPLKFLCHKGWRSQKAVDNAIRQLDRLITEERSGLNRETLKSDLRSKGTSTSGYTNDDFLGSSPCPKYGLYDANDEHRDPNLCENKPVDSSRLVKVQSKRASNHCTKKTFRY